MLLEEGLQGCHVVLVGVAELLLDEDSALDTVLLDKPAHMVQTPPLHQVFLGAGGGRLRYRWAIAPRRSSPGSTSFQK